MNIDIGNLPPEAQQFLLNLTQSKTSSIGDMPTLKGHLQQTIIALDNAWPSASNPDNSFKMPGFRFWVDAKTSGQAQVFFDDPTAQLAGIPCIPGMVLKMPIEDVFIVAPAQPGAVLAINWGVFDVVPPLNAPGVTPGLAYAASYKSTTNLGANGNDQIVAPASNVGGIQIVSAQYDDQAAATGTQAILAKTSAPATVIDGDIILSGWSGAGVPQPYLLTNPILIPKTKGLFRLSTLAETAALANVLYTLLNP